jgi:hypothetical protein
MTTTTRTTTSGDARPVRFLAVPGPGDLVRAVLGGGFAGALLVIATGSVVLGRGYYLLDPAVRPEHELHGLLAPGAPGGVALGVLGTALMLAMLLYSVRKRFPRASWPGPLPDWLRFHIICGVMGPILIVIHGGFHLPRGLVAIGFWCMVLVGLSGLFGRYLYGLFPRGTAGRELDMARAREELAELRARLVGQTAGSRGEEIAAAVRLARRIDRPVRGLFDLVGLGREVRLRSRRIHTLLAASTLQPPQLGEVERLLVGQLRMQRGLEAWEVTRRLFRYWHLFHQPLARAMYLIVGVHVAVAVLFGGALVQLSRLFG